MVSPFDVLGLDDDADEADVERAYRERVKEAHPDQGGTVEEFQLVRRAYRELGERDRNGDADDETDPADIDLTDEAGEVDAVQPVRVEFLDYEAIDDYGWSLDDDDLFRKASHADLDPAAHGRLLVHPDESLLEAAERSGFGWPFSCRGGACANCAVFLVEGELSQPADHIMPEELAERGFRLSCNGYPVSDELKVVFNVKQLAELDDLILPPGPFTRR
ncbi:ferredoxin Fer [Halorubrum lacusprofundi]|jgi:ferredoxin|uniref:Ferredoxin n=1 Tax=Halorubrum lacusprofundi (strain ATCC 49239 / DSM 5036 / JCM 8891 / ACAM 34) TaxID=416348 RepID=B9LPB2_HALLT|nr:ferredoxin Fer [Halorubrum lacusprofundi]ACM57200.1 ferredoxin [Halorubrum lacusprofundi ATCC 49239]MCG1007275.1 2Fe-2S iron-sulfur cluster-binding protein [Halorubrum lacusprofundi]